MHATDAMEKWFRIVRGELQTTSAFNSALGDNWDSPFELLRMSVLRWRRVQQEEILRAGGQGSCALCKRHIMYQGDCTGCPVEEGGYGQTVCGQSGLAATLTHQKVAEILEIGQELMRKMR